MGQSVVSHRRNYKTLVDQMEKVANIFARMQGLEKNMQQNLKDLNRMLGNGGVDQDGNIQEMNKILSQSLLSVERSAKNDIRESLEPVGPFLLRKKLEGEVDTFLGDILTFLDNPRADVSSGNGSGAGN